MRKLCIVLFTFFTTLPAFAVIKTVVGNSGQGWGTANNWLPTGVPQSGDLVIIPPGLTISVKGSFYTGTENLSISILGTLDFEPSGKLDLGNRSTVQIMNVLSKLTTNNTGSEVIWIGGVTKYKGNVDGNLKGPIFASAATGASPIGFYAGVLPVQLTSFTLQEQTAGTLLQWTTAAEVNTMYFEVECSADAQNWKAIGRVNATGSNAQYSFTANKPLADVVYYRLKIIDNDRTATYSAVVQSNRKPTTRITLTPNPARTFINVALSKSNATYQLQVINAAGQLLKQQPASARRTSFIPIDISALQNGIYYLVIREKGILIATEAFSVQ